MYQHYLCIYSFLYIESHGTLNTTTIIQMRSVIQEVDPQVVNWKSNKQEVNNKIVFLMK
jgi:hypothetical protein